MKTDAFALGILSISGQVLILRSLVTAFGGSEMLIGAALAGWLAAVALGAISGKGSPGKGPLLVLTFALAVTVIASTVGIRFLPLLVNVSPLAVTPTGWAYLFAVTSPIPAAWLAGRLFTVIASGPPSAPGAIATAYLWEGIGAFVGGAAVAGLSIVGIACEAQSITFALAGVCLVFLNHTTGRRIIAIGFNTTLLMVLTLTSGSWLPVRLDRVRLAPFEVLTSFDSQQGHHTLVRRDGMTALVTNQTVEATTADSATNEWRLIPALLHRGAVDRVLYFGRPEFGMAGMADALGIGSLTAIDPRRRLTEQLAVHKPGNRQSAVVHTDPIRYLASTSHLSTFDLAAIDATNPDNYLSARLLTPTALRMLRAGLDDSGIVTVITAYDSDRYLSEEAERALRLIHGSLREVLPHVWAWPGEATILFASRQAYDAMDPDTLFARLDRLPYRPAAVRADQLHQQLDPLRGERLRTALAGPVDVNDLNRSPLPARHQTYRERLSPLGSILAAMLDRSWLPLTGLILLVLLLALPSLRAAQVGRAAGRWMLVTIGFTSLSLELCSLYLYQSLAGSLLAELGLLMGSFMLGLAGGAYQARPSRDSGLAMPSLALLLVAALLFWLTWDRGGYNLLIYHSLLLLTIGAATGVGFVAATNAFYDSERRTGRGTSYAWEIAGSAPAALLTLSFLLPQFGLDRLLPALAVHLALLLVVLIARRPRRLAL